MIKKHLKALLLSTVFCCLPIVVGLALWDRLPEKMPLHWNFNGKVDSYGSKAVAVFVIPLIMIAALWICALGTMADKKNKNQNPKPFNIMFFIMPILSNVSSVLVYLTALGKKPPVSSIMFVFMGFLFAFIGNYMPKCTQNRTIGIKIPTTLKSESNWNATHRFAGKLWAVGGILTAVCGFLPQKFHLFTVVIMLALIIIPIVFSLIYKKREERSNECDKN